MTQIIDLSLLVEEGMLHPFHKGPTPAFQLTITKDHDQGGVRGTCVSMYLHVGTHIDAPLHFVKGGKAIDELPLEQLVGDAVALDLRHKREREPIDAGDLEEALGKLRRKGIETKPGDMVLICTGHHERTWGSLAYWQDSPYLTEEAAQWIVDHGFAAAGYDFFQEVPAERRRPEVNGPVHTKLLSNFVLNIEYLTGLDRVVGQKFLLVAAPILIKGVEGAPARVVAILK